MGEANDSRADGAPGALFSTVASDNAEIVPPAVPHGPESMWSTQATPEPDTLADDDVVADAVDDVAPPPPPDWSWGEGARPSSGGFGPWATNDTDGPGVEGLFSAEPVSRDADLVDEADPFDPTLTDDDPWTERVRPASGASVFSSGASAPPADDQGSPWTTLDSDWVPTGAPGAAASRQGWDDPERTVTRPRSTPVTEDEGTAHRAESPVPDPHGLEAAVSRLHPDDQERACVPIAVCGALLEEGEFVLGAVTGQMLGRPAAVVVTEERVLIANDRRWQPIVDIYTIDSKLVVRGRHDRQIAALSFADASRLSMVDGIVEVELAIELADRIRDAGPVADGPAGA